MQREIYLRGHLLQELAHMIKKASKSHNLLSASWRIRETIGIVHYESKGLELENLMV